MPTTPHLPIDQLVKGFQDHSLPLSQWTHEAHLRTGLWHLYHYSPDEATCILRAGIITYNHAQGGTNTPTGGYHETITLFWIAVLHHFIQQFSSDTTFAALEQQFLAGPLSDKNLPFLYFSRQRLLSTAARSRWMEPDLQAMPGEAGST